MEKMFVCLFFLNAVFNLCFQYEPVDEIERTSSHAGVSRPQSVTGRWCLFNVSLNAIYERIGSGWSSAGRILSRRTLIGNMLCWHLIKFFCGSTFFFYKESEGKCRLNQTVL